MTVNLSDVTHENTGFDITPEEIKEAEEFFRRIDDPQDLEDGLLAVHHEEMLNRVKQSLGAEWELRLFEALV